MAEEPDPDSDDDYIKDSTPGVPKSMNLLVIPSDTGTPWTVLDHLNLYYQDAESVSSP